MKPKDLRKLKKALSKLADSFDRYIKTHCDVRKYKKRSIKY